MKFQSVTEILDFAIKKEEEARDFYLDLAGKVKNPVMVDVFRDFAHQEEGHKAKLLQVKADKMGLPGDAKIKDLKIGDNLEEIAPAPNLDYQSALIIAMKAEKNAFKLYNDLAAAAQDPGLKSILQGLAQEEAIHKLRFEVEYDDKFLSEN